LLSLALLAACAGSRPEVSTPVRAPSLEGIALETLDGGRVTLGETLRGRPALISLWATWCTSCATEFDALGRLAPKAAALGAYVLAISEGEPRATVAGFVRDRQLAYPQLVDEAFSLGDALGARRVPMTLVVDRKGEVVFRGGTLDRDALAALDRVIGPATAAR
jgi:peroxiredoxin